MKGSKLIIGLCIGVILFLAFETDAWLNFGNKKKPAPKDIKVPGKKKPVPPKDIKVPGYMGCFSDSLFPRAMSMKNDNVPNIETCINICRQHHQNYAGLQYGKQCFCGSAYGKYGPSRGCSMKCKLGGICGGLFANSVYKVVSGCTCSGSGDPHYRTFDGQMIHFMGICKYTLATNKPGSNNTYFAVEVKNEHRGNTRVAYTRMVDVKLKGVTIRLLPANKVLVNSESHSLPIKDYMGFSATYSAGWVTVTTTWGLRVQFDGRHRITVFAPSIYADQLTGICGDCNGKKDDFRTKTGKDVSKDKNKYSLIGTSYQVTDDSDKPTTKCKVTDIKTDCTAKQTERCNVINNNGIFGACINKLGAERVKEYFDSCKIDNCIYLTSPKMINTVVCQAIEGFASECEKQGITLNWRVASKCPLKCPPNQIYKYKAKTCQPSCTNRVPTCNTFSEACVCKPNYLLSGDKCVHSSKCGCMNGNIYMEVLQVLVAKDCTKMTICGANGKLLHTALPPCGPKRKCKINNGKRMCVCDSGLVLLGGKCTSPAPTLCKHEGKLYKKGVSFKKECNTCVCGSNGQLGCTKMACIPPTLCKHEGKLYRKGESFKKECNTCVCGSNGQAGCTKMGCILPTLCKHEGKLYRKGESFKKECNTCVCGSNGQAGCTKMGCIPLPHPCVLNPCQNNGTCIKKGPSYTCSCQLGYSGDTCSDLTDPCARNPCQNGGQCIVGILGGYICKCQAGFIGKHCSQRSPDCVCSGSGDPHYKTFDGQWIHFMGPCKYTLAKPIDGVKLPHFSVEVKNEHRGNTRVAYTRLVDIKINGVTLRILPANRVMVNGELMELPLTDYMGYTVKYSAGWVTVTTKFGLKVQFDGNHRVLTRVPGVYRNQLTGICGDCNGIRDDYRTKTGVNVSKKPNKYSLIGKSYEVIDDSDKPTKNCEVVDVPDICNKNDTKVCDIMINKKGVFGPCLMRIKDAAKDYFESCKIDTCANNKDSKSKKFVTCQSFEALGRMCEDIGVLINWRQAIGCPKKCPKNMLYRYSTSPIQPSCADRKPKSIKQQVEGCVCRTGFILSGTECVPIKSCGCVYDGMYLKVNSKILSNDCQQLITCHPNGTVSISAGCNMMSMCVVEGGNRMCKCLKGFEMIDGQCVEVVIPPLPPIIDPVHQLPVMHMFVRVNVAYIEGNVLQKSKEEHVDKCAWKCINAKCKSFNYDELTLDCHLFSFNAATNVVVTQSECPYRDYYQLIDSKKVVIHGARIITCIHLEEYGAIKSEAACEKTCNKFNCRARDYSEFDEDCSFTHTDQRSFGLTGDEFFVFTETYDQLPTLPQN